MSAPSSSQAAARDMLLRMVAEARELKQAAGGSVTDAVADWLSPNYLLAVQEKLAGTEGTDRFDVLRLFVQDWTLLRRGDHAAARLQLDREALELLRANSESRTEKAFREWLKKPEIQEELFPKKERGISPETFDRIARELNLM